MRAAMSTHLRSRAIAVLACLLVAAALLAAPAFAKDGKNQVDTALLPDSSFIYETSIYALQTSDTYYESQTVQVTGEVVGDIILAETDPENGRCWITLDSLEGEQEATLQVYVTEAQAKLIDSLGRFERTGTIVSVTGKYHLTCDQHDGLSDLHATSLTVFQQGSSQHTKFSIEPFVPAFALVIVGLAFFGMYRRKREELR